jgi:hypothetical protein
MIANPKGVPMSNPNQRLMAWQIGTDTGKVKEILDDLRRDMFTHCEAAMASFCEMETKARPTLNAAGVHTIMYVPTSAMRGRSASSRGSGVNHTR